MQLTSKEQHTFTDLKRQQQSLTAAGIQHGDMVPFPIIPVFFTASQETIELLKDTAGRLQYSKNLIFKDEEGCDMDMQSSRLA